MTCLWHAEVPACASYLSTELAPHLVMRRAQTGCKTGNMAELDGVQVTPAALQSLALVNYGHFTSMRVDNHRIRGLSQHLDRLVHDCRVVFNSFLDRDRVRELIRHAIADEPGSFIARVTIFDPDLQLGHLGGAAKPRILVTTRSAGNWPPTPMRVQSAAYQRESPEIKHVGLFGALWHRRQAELNGYDDAVFVTASSFISEGATWNIGFFDGDRVVWPAGEILPGITMRLDNRYAPERVPGDSGGAYMTTIRIWSGREIRALREARRMSQRDFAAHLGISERMIANGKPAARR